MAAVVEIIRPMKLSTISRAEMSITTPFAPVRTISLLVVLQGDGDVVLQVDLDRDQQDSADAQDRDLVHQLPAATRFTTSLPVRRIASSMASARVALVWMSRTRCRERRPSGRSGDGSRR